MTDHIPVLLEEVVSLLAKHPHPKRVVDATVGLGGYAEAILSRFPEIFLLGIDRDEEALSIAKDKLSCFEGRFCLVQGDFAEIASHLKAKGWDKADAIVADLGVSSLQLDRPERGFSFDREGPLDMRMSPSENTTTAAQLINELSEDELARIFIEYGEERFGKRMARAIVRWRSSKGPITSTKALVEVIRSSLPAPLQRKLGRHPARRVFQALRIAVNDELEALKTMLESSCSVLYPNGVIIVVSYHSLEDRIVKRHFLMWQHESLGKVIFKGPLTPSAEEIKRNRRARSAKLRAFQLASDP
ncbi:MAG TPA: 16S rRNA (cytosine(1402)-N(4))-methyltransferase RsmH [Thermosynergistes sp.]|nr:16S rRNA (cytosine(1402)-N(4))-methyltransferase RsmH [Thermosynergistes sp.]